MSKLAMCPCGATPTALLLEPGATLKYAYASGNCCGEWRIEFFTNYIALNASGCMDLAEQTWNEAPRKGDSNNE